MTTCADTGVFVRGGVGQAHPQKTSDKFFCFFIFSPQLIYRGGPMVYLKEHYNFLGSRGGPTFFRGGGGPTFSRGGVQHSRGVQ